MGCFEDVPSLVSRPSPTPGILSSLLGLLRGGRRGRERGQQRAAVCSWRFAGAQGHAGSGRRQWHSEPAAICFQHFQSRGPHHYWKTPRGPPDPERETPLGELTPGALPSPNFSTFCSAKCFSMAGTNAIVHCLERAF